MKLNRRQLRRLIQEAIYFPPNISKDDIDYFNKLRSSHSAENKRKADAVANADFNLGFSLGGMPDEKPDKPMITMQDGSNEGLGNYINVPGGMKEISMAIEDDIQDYIVTNGSKVQASEDPDDYYYSIPEQQVYEYFMRNQRVSRDVIDFVLEVNTYGIVQKEINYLGRKVPFLQTYEY